MSAVLNSFDKSKESTQNNKSEEVIKGTTNIGVRSYRSESSIRNVFNSDEDDEMEFEDSVVETPKQYIRKGNSSFSGTRYNSRKILDNEQGQSEFIIKNTTVKIPLKDGDEDMGPRKYSTPNSVNRLNRYGVRNGTPLKLPPINSSSIQENDIDDATPNDIDEIKQDTLIRSRKLISDNNKFSPGRIPTRKSSLTRFSPNIANVNLSRNGTSIIDDKITSPPTNLKVKPLSIGSVQKTDSSQFNSPKDIEFDSSDDNEIIKNNGDNEINDNIINNSKNNNNKDGINNNNNDKNNNNNNNKDGINNNNNNNNNNNDDDNNNSRSSRDNSISVRAYSRSNSPLIQKRSFYKTDGSKYEIYNKDRRQTSSPDNELGNISRADLLERINNTINSIKESEKLSSPSISKKTTNQGFENFTPNVINDYSSSSESPVELLDQLDSHIFNNKDSLKEKSDLENMNHAFLPDFDLNTEVSSISRPTINPSITMNGNSLALKYNENILGGVKSRTAATPANESILNNSQPSSVPQGEHLEDWSIEKWSKLMKIINSNKFSRKDIINSGVLRSSLGCMTKQEFQIRVDFLMEFKRALDLKRSRLQRAKRKRGLKPKIKYTKKSF